MSVSIADMEIAATSLPEIGLGGDANVIEVGDLGDDFGMSLLTNKKYTNSNPQVSTSASSGNTFNIASFNAPPAGLQEVEVSNLEPLQSIDLNLNSEPLPSICLLYTSPSPRDLSTSRMPSSA